MPGGCDRRDINGGEIDFFVAEVVRLPIFALLLLVSEAEIVYWEPYYVARTEKDAKELGMKGLPLIILMASESGKPAPVLTTMPRAEVVIFPE